MALSKDERRARNAAYMAGYRKKNAEAIAAYLIEYRTANADTAKAYAAAWYAKNKAGKVAEYRAQNKAKLDHDAAAYREANREARRAQWIEWSRANPDAVKTNSKNRRARERNAPGALSRDIEARLLTLQRYKCVNCRCDLRKTGHHLDHITPLALGGHNSDDNVQMLCPPCNMKKHAKDPIAWAQQQGRLL